MGQYRDRGSRFRGWGAVGGGQVVAAASPFVMNTNERSGCGGSHCRTATLYLGTGAQSTWPEMH